MRYALLGLLLAACEGDLAQVEPVGAGADGEAARLAMSVLVSGLDNPFEVIVGPDGYLWVTERTSGEVSRISTVDGSVAVAIDIPEVLVTPGTQDGLLGMALDPRLGLGAGSDYVYLAYTYDGDPDPVLVDSNVRIARYSWDAAAGTLGSPVTLLEGLHGSTDHNSGRLLMGPDKKLYYSIGDQGNNQLSRYCIANHAQQLPTRAQIRNGDWDAYQGKVLRMNLDGSIPRDNPEIKGVHSHIYTFGHRNPQGLVFTPDGALIEAEHGPKSDDEVNVLVAGANYGWPNVAGFQDDQAYVYADWSASQNPPCEDLEYSDFEIPPSVPFQEESAFTKTFVEPNRTFYSVADDFDFQDPACEVNGLYFICWPTIAPSSLAVSGDQLLITSLKLGTLYRVDLDDGAGNLVPDNGDPSVAFHTVDRYRRVTVGADGNTLYVATDVSGYTMGDDGIPTNVLENPGSILVLTPE
jgi:PQQ-dependent dehydrogenase (s-GDH family)